MISSMSHRCLSCVLVTLLSGCAGWQPINLNASHRIWFVAENPSHDISKKLSTAMRDYHAVLSNTPDQATWRIAIEDVDAGWQTPDLESSYPTQIKRYHVHACLAQTSASDTTKRRCFHPERALLLTDQQGFSTSQAVQATENMVWKQMIQSMLHALMVMQPTERHKSN
jgi:hypothetical protein